jgi:hypothetical protein
MLTVEGCRVITATLHTGEALPEPMKTGCGGVNPARIGGAGFLRAGLCYRRKTGIDADGISAQNASRERADLIATERALPTAEK